MVDEDPQIKRGQREPEYAPVGHAVAFADAVASCTYTNEVSKFYLSRADPSANGAGAAQLQYVGQVVMPLSGFINSVAFLNSMVRGMRDDEKLPPVIREMAEEVVGKRSKESDGGS
jgi:hypothetical protein